MRPKEAIGEISLCYRAILLCSPSLLPCPEEYSERLRSYAIGVSIFSLNECEADSLFSDRFDESFDFSETSSGILTRMRDHARQHRLPLPGSYALAGLCLDCDVRYPTYCDTRIPFTKTEAMILRYLIRTYPEGSSVHHIMRYAMRPGSLSEPSGIRTHIFGINKKFEELTGRRLIQSFPGEGYRILTPAKEASVSESTAYESVSLHTM